MKTKGVRTGPPDEKLGIRGSQSCQIFLDDVRLPNDAAARRGRRRLQGRDVDARRRPHRHRRAGARHRPRRARGRARPTRSERKTFGKPIAQHQAIQFKLADMATELDAARLLTLRAATLKDTAACGTRGGGDGEAVRVGGRATAPPRRRSRSSAATATSTEFPVERHFRDAKITEIYEGTSEIQRLVIASKPAQGVNHAVDAWWCWRWAVPRSRSSRGGGRPGRSPRRAARRGHQPERHDAIERAVSSQGAGAAKLLAGGVRAQSQPQARGRRHRRPARWRRRARPPTCASSSPRWATPPWRSACKAVGGCDIPGESVDSPYMRTVHLGAAVLMKKGLLLVGCAILYSACAHREPPPPAEPVRQTAAPQPEAAPSPTTRSRCRDPRHPQRRDGIERRARLIE